MRTWIVISLVIICALAVNVVEGTAFHLDEQRTGNFSDEGPKRGELVYKAPLTGFIDSSPVVWNVSAYLTNSPGMSPSTENLGLYAINATSGSVEWNVSGIYGMATPAVSDDYLFVHSYDNETGNGVLASFYASNGTERWNITLEENVGWWKVSSSPLIHDGRVYVLSYGGDLRCMDFHGNELWNKSSGGVNENYFSSPSSTGEWVIYPQNDSSEYYLTAVNETGSTVWKRPVNGTLTNTPVISEGNVYIATESKLYGFEVGGSELWNVSFDGGMSTPAIAYNKLFVGSENGKFYCFNTTNGKEIWNFTAIENPSAFDSIKSSPAYSNGILYFASNEANGTMFALNASNGSLEWKHELGTYVMSSPFIHENRLFIGADDGNVYLFGLWKGKVDLNPARVSVELESGNITQISGKSALAALMNTGLNLTVTNSSWGLYIESIAGIEPEEDNYWMYAVNGIEPQVGAEDYELSDNDRVEFFYAPWGTDPENADYRIVIDVNLTSIIWQGSVELEQGNFTVTKDNRTYEVSNFTALGALNQAVDSSYTVSDEWYESYGTLLVDSIHGIENNGSSGWMYWINYPDEPAPSAGANKYAVEAGDTVYWYYSDNMSTTPENSTKVLKIEVEAKEVVINSLNVSEGSRGGNATAWVDLKASEEGWYVTVVSGTNDGESIAGISTFHIGKNESLKVPVIVSIPQQVPAGDYELYAGIYKLNDYPNNILNWYGNRTCEVK